MPSSLAYPDVLEQAWLRHAMQVTNCGLARLAVERLECDAGSLSDAFTTGRDPSFSGYSGNRRALAAYGLFFFPRAFTRTRLVLHECLSRRVLPPGDRGLRIIDLGAGTGAAGLACLHELSRTHPETPLHLELVDTAKNSIDLSRILFASGQQLWPRASITSITSDARTYTSSTPADIIICSFAINEWMEQQPDALLHEWVTRQMRQLKPGGWLILLEPALRFAVERMERLRDHVAASGMGAIIAPCPHHQACPMLAESRGWCHEVRTWHVPDSLRWINRRLQRDVHLLKFSFLALDHSPRIAGNTPFMRIVSPVRKEKGKFVFHGCGNDGLIHKREWLTRHLNDEQKTLSEELERGDLVMHSSGLLLGDGKTERLNEPPQRISIT